MNYDWLNFDFVYVVVVISGEPMLWVDVAIEMKYIIETNLIRPR